MCWSAPIEDVADWIYEGVIYEKRQDPEYIAGKYQYYGYVQTKNGFAYGKKKSDYYVFDPAGAIVMKLDSDMKTIISEPQEIFPVQLKLGLHNFFEAPSIRKFGEWYYFVYSSNWSHELCYCMSKYPDKEFEYKGVLLSNGDVGIDGKNFRDRTYPSGNNHGSVIKIADDYYVFGHRHTSYWKEMSIYNTRWYRWTGGCSIHHKYYGWCTNWLSLF